MTKKVVEYIECCRDCPYLGFVSGSGSRTCQLQDEKIVMSDEMDKQCPLEDA